MKIFKFNDRHIWRHLLILLFFLTSGTRADSIETLHLLIPAGKGGGWDTTAREVGRVLSETRLANRVYFENFVGAGGGRALMDLVQKPDKHLNTLMVQSSPLILRHLTGTIEYGFRDIQPVSILIAEYQAIAVPVDSQFKTAMDLVNSIRQSPIRNPVIGGSSFGSLDHISFALIAQAARLPVEKIRYVASDGGGEAMVRLQQGFGVALISGIGEVINAYKRGDIRILGITSPGRLSNLPEIKTFTEQGLPIEFANWRGFFANSDIPSQKLKQFKDVLKTMNQTEAWKSTRDKHLWSELFLQDEALTAFLEDQERKMRQALSSLNIE